MQYSIQTFDFVINFPDSADPPYFAFKMYYIIRLLKAPVFSFLGAEPLQTNKSNPIILFILTKAELSGLNPLTTPK